MNLGRGGLWGVLAYGAMFLTFAVVPGRSFTGSWNCADAEGGAASSARPGQPAPRVPFASIHRVSARPRGTTSARHRLLLPRSRSARHRCGGWIARDGRHRDSGHRLDCASWIPAEGLTAAVRVGSLPGFAPSMLLRAWPGARPRTRVLRRPCRLAAWRQGSSRGRPRAPAWARKARRVSGAGS